MRPTLEVSVFHIFTCCDKDLLFLKEKIPKSIEEMSKICRPICRGKGVISTSLTIKQNIDRKGSRESSQKDRQKTDKKCI